MGWRDLIAKPETLILPWTGGRKVSCRDRFWQVQGRLPPEFGWYEFTVDGGREARIGQQTACDPAFEKGHKLVRGYLVGDRLIPDTARVDPDPAKLIDQTYPVLIAEMGLDRFTRAVVVKTLNEAGNQLVYLRQEFPQGPEGDVEAAYQDRKDSIRDIPGVTPALDLAFQWLTYQRAQAEIREREEEARRVEEERRREAAERLAQAMKDTGTGAGRRALAQRDFKAAARAALAISGAELLDVRPSANRGQMVVQYRFRHRRLECEVNAETLRIVDAGVCLDDHRGTKGDTFYTLESLPAVINDAMNLGRLVVWRHAPGDREGVHDRAGRHHDWEDDDDD